MIPADRGVAGLHWVRYGIAGDQKYLLGEFAETYDQLVVNANMVAHMPSAMSQFIAQKLRKPFVIDPQTHAFQHEIDHLLSTSKKSSGKLKRSWGGLVQRYGAPLDAIFAGENPRSLRPEDLQDAQLLREFCRRVLFFQRDEIHREVEEGPDAEYIRFLAEETGEDLAMVPPRMLIAPYFFIGGSWQEHWLDLTTRCLAASRIVMDAEAPDIPLAAEIVVSKEVVSDSDFRTTAVERLLNCKPDVFLLWIDDFSEQAASPTMLRRYVEFVDQLSATGTPVVNLFGGYLSVAQARGGALIGKLRGVCHGLEYGESKAVVPIAGGIPVARFYSNNLHHRLPPRIAVQEVRALGGFANVEQFHHAICNCEECRAVINADPEKGFRVYTESQEKFILRSGRRVTMEFPTAAAADHCTRHYMWCKGREYREELDHDGLKQALTKIYDDLVPHVGPEFSAHAKTWAESL